VRGHVATWALGPSGRPGRFKPVLVHVRNSMSIAIADVTEVFRFLDQDLFKKLAHACKYGLLKPALYLKSKPEYCVFTIRSMSCVLTYRQDAYM